MRLLSLLPRIFAIFLIILPPLFAVRQSEKMQGSDFVMTFYPAGAMIASGQAANIYPPPSATSFIDAPFNLFAHKTLAQLPKQDVAIYMYSPLVAAVFVPFSWLSPTAALLLWQTLSLLVLALVAYMLSAGSRKKAFDYFFMLVLFCPVFHTLLIGHLGIVLGLLPLCLGYLLWQKGRELGAGYVWGFLALKPQFLPAALLVAGALLLRRRAKVALGLVLGLLSFAALSAAVLGPDIFVSWLRCLKMADTLFANPIYGFPEYMVVSLPAVLLQSFPHALRATAKMPIYAFAGLVGLVTLWRSVQVLRSAELEARSVAAAIAVAAAETDADTVTKSAAETDEETGTQSAAKTETEAKPNSKAATAIEAKSANVVARAHALIMTLGLLVLPLVLPHFIFYDMCGLGLICIIANQDFWTGTDGGAMRAVRRSIWWACNIYFVIFMFVSVGFLKQWYALSLILIFGLLYYRVFKLSCKTNSPGVPAAVEGE